MDKSHLAECSEPEVHVDALIGLGQTKFSMSATAPVRTVRNDGNKVTDSNDAGRKISYL